jgi:hypothetical protein
VDVREVAVQVPLPGIKSGISTAQDILAGVAGGALTLAARLALPPLRLASDVAGAIAASVLPDGGQAVSRHNALVAILERRDAGVKVGQITVLRPLNRTHSAL